MLELFEMWALVEALGLMCLPLTFTVFKNLPDRGWAFTKTTSIALLAFCVWLPLMTIQILPFSQLFILGVLLILLALNIIGFQRMYRSIWRVIREQRAYILACEVVFFGMVFLLGWIRSYNPNIQSFEMFMDEGFLSAIMRSPHFPPNDMWLSGYPINYYYYAHYTIALLAKLIGQSPSIAFNTGICVFFGLTAVNLFGVTCNIVAWARTYRRPFRGANTGSTRRSFLRRKRSAEENQALFPSMRGTMIYGFLTMLMGLVLGNLASTQQWWQQHGDLPPFYWFNVTRVVTNTINEFPAFSFLLSCFHAHVLTLAFTILAIALAFNFFLERNDEDPESVKGLGIFGHGLRLPLNLFFTAIALGGLFTMNGWDFPTYLGLTLLCIILQQWMTYKGFNWLLVLDVFTVCAALTALSFFLYMPFYLNFISPSQGIGIVDAANRSAIQNEMLIYGTFMFIFVTLLIVHFLRERPAPVASVTPGDEPELVAVSASSSEDVEQEEDAECETVSVGSSSSVAGSTGTRISVTGAQPKPVSSSGSSNMNEPPARVERLFARPGGTNWRMLYQVAVIVVALLALLLLKNSLWFVVSGIITALGAEMALYHLQDRPRAFVLMLGTLAFFLVAMTEVVYLRDVFADSYPRMNTVFKFYFQAWALLSITCGAGLYYIVEVAQIRLDFSGLQLWVRRGGQALWAICFSLLLLAGMVYPIVGTYQRSNDFQFRTNSLDGMDYLQSYQPGDYAAIRWINSHITGDPVIVEAYAADGGDYSDYGRVSAFTGLPTLMGWLGHEYQWRVNWLNRGNNADDFYSRGAAIKLIYTSNDPRTVLGLMNHYNAQYLYVGYLEQITYPGINLQRFKSFMQVVYSKDGVTIYKVPQGS